MMKLTFLANIFLSGILIGWAPTASALPKEVCVARAKMIEAVAVERDQGARKEDVIRKLEKRLGPRATGIRDYVEGVYMMRTSTPNEIWNKVFDLCLAE